METAKKSNSTHIGRKISLIRELKGMKQDALAFELGVSQQLISKIENSETIDDELLTRVADVLGVTKEGIEAFSLETVFNNINNFHDSSIQNNFNPIDKIVELYERLLKSEQEKIEILKGSK
ncbi:helix-turn-helix transcriptional regulator [Algoriphagus sp. D3-2-R+10]|uniref:helix-turn-helix domain-containing protein n=1 Tax=Algoriphagus aurantiacus TaxID=3103948 RepID=UPI002B38A6BB|nr:helix-turn-helix transcriptional regulator [Algoriphagus sp. D3-2-R+10]MEB2774617.1 helix-turn-helix transcriptional regulator [Algoriphagus sp. D3-2-R+10]